MNVRTSELNLDGSSETGDQQSGIKLPQQQLQATSQEKLARFLELRDTIKLLTEEKKTILNSLKDDLSALGNPNLRVIVNGATFQIRIATRIAHSVAWDAFQLAHPEIYGQFITGISSEYVEVREIQPKENSAPGVLMT
jgi:hypothetical protein